MARAALGFALFWLASAGGGGRRRRGNGDRWGVKDKLDCSASLSDGPEDADVEVRLGGIEPSTASESVYLMWWAARESATPYDLLTNISSATLYGRMKSAYPKSTDADFNGGKVRVSESGEAVIRVRSPSVYRVYQWTAWPHIHLRLCEGDDDDDDDDDDRRGRGKSKVVFTGSQVYIRKHCNTINILSATRYSGSGSTSLMTTNAATTTQATTTQPPASHFDTAIKALDLDALEFSPVYDCLLDEEFYDHFSDACTAQCPENAVPVDGQCVRPETLDPAANLEAAWQLSIECNEECWALKMNYTLHNVRLSIAGHLDIPFQEVTAIVGFQASRRLTTSAFRTAFLTVQVISGRVSTSQGTTLMTSFPQDAAAMTAIMGVNVGTVSALNSTTPQQSEQSTMGPSNDPYLPAYNAIEDSPKAVAPPNSVVSSLPTEVIVGVAGGIVFLVVVAAVTYVVRRARARRANHVQKANEKQVGKVAEEDAPEASNNKKMEEATP